MSFSLMWQWLSSWLMTWHMMTFDKVGTRWDGNKEEHRRSALTRSAEEERWWGAMKRSADVEPIVWNPGEKFRCLMEHGKQKRCFLNSPQDLIDVDQIRTKKDIFNYSRIWLLIGLHVWLRGANTARRPTSRSPLRTSDLKRSGGAENTKEILVVSSASQSSLRNLGPLAFRSTNHIIDYLNKGPLYSIIHVFKT